MTDTPFRVKDSLSYNQEVAVGKETDGSEDCLEGISVLKRQYLSVLPSRLLQIARQINAAANSGNVVDLNDAILDAHRLLGTCGCFGLNEIGESMGRIESLLTTIVQSEGGIEDDSLSSVQNMICDAMSMTLKASSS